MLSDINCSGVLLDALTVDSLRKKDQHVQKPMIKPCQLTEVTSNGMVNTIRNEILHAANTDSVTIGCCRCKLPYFQMDIDDMNKARKIAKPSKYAMASAVQYSCFLFKCKIN